MEFNWQLISLIISVIGSISAMSYYLGRRIGSFGTRLKTVESSTTLYQKDNEKLKRQNGEYHKVIDEIHSRLSGIEATLKERGKYE